MYLQELYRKRVTAGNQMEYLTECLQKYLEITKLLEIESKKDPETEPYRSKYKAKTLLLELYDLAKKYLEDLDDTKEEYHLTKALISNILAKIGVIYTETEELAKGEEYFMKCMESVSDPLRPYNIIVSIQTRNQLGFLWSQRSKQSEAEKFLEEAEKLYNEFKNRPENVAKRLCDFLEDPNSKEGQKELEITHTLTKFYLAQVYGAQKKLLKSAIYCHETLKMALANNEYDPIDWALNSATLSKFFMERILLKQARHHLAAASYFLDNYEETLKEMKGSQEEIDSKKEELCHVSADVSRCWAKYGIFLLQHSKNSMNNTEDDDSPTEEKNEDLEKLWFDSLDLSLYENQITDSVVITFEDAREVFLIAQKHLNKAKEYYTLEDRASDHVQIVEDHSQLFRHLTAFEPDTERQYKMMKKRVDMLQVVVKELNPKYYMSLCRHLWYELGEIFYDMMLIIFQKAKDSGDVPGPQVLKKINTLAEAGISNFNNFIDSVKDKESKELPDSLPEELIEPILVAHFYLGRLYYKYITHDKRKQIENTKKAYECFKYLVDNSEKSEKAKSVIGEELNISKEMMTLLQMKILQF